MADVLKNIEAEEENVRAALENLETVMGREGFSAVELAATAAFLHNIYTGVENILKQVLKEHEIATPDTSSWHKDLLAKADKQEGFLHGKLSAGEGIKERKIS